jgi:PAT family beta-lactamase induction signal transducer AmpG
MKSTETSLPALSENAFLRYFNFIALYFAQGIPEGMLFYGIPAWMAMNGKSAGEIASFAVACGLPWSFKFIVAPLMDRYTILSMGRKRPWVIFGQLGLMASFIIMAFIPDPLNNLNTLLIAGFTVSGLGTFESYREHRKTTYKFATRKCHLLFTPALLVMTFTNK